ncbi:MAG: hypothetical protein ACI36Y_06170 [Coriobacteriales bacterium]
MSTPILVLRNKLYEHRSNPSTKMKDIDRWLFNINMLSAQIAAEHPSSIALPVYEKATRDWSDNTALRLNEKSTPEALEVFEKYCPPALDKGIAALERLVPSDERVIGEHRQVLEEAQAANSFYRSIAGLYGQGMAAYRELLPLWIVKGSSPLFTLELWEDEEKVLDLGDALYQEFLAAGYHREVCERFNELVYSCYNSYAAKFFGATDEQLAQAAQLKAKPLDELYRIKHSQGYRGLPSWLEAKEQLIWNLVACALYGPENARPQYFSHTEVAVSTDSLNALSADPRLHQGSGTAVLTRIHEGGATDVVATINLGREGDPALEDGLVMVLGREYQGVPSADELGEVPEYVCRHASEEDHRHHYATLLDADSARHLGVYIIDGQLLLIDLGSKNGTFIRRGKGTGERYLVMPGRSAGLVDAFKARGYSFEVATRVVAMRGDQVFLGASQFELL